MKFLGMLIHTIALFTIVGGLLILLFEYAVEDLPEMITYVAIGSVISGVIALAIANEIRPLQG